MKVSAGTAVKEPWSRRFASRGSSRKAAQTAAARKVAAPAKPAKPAADNGRRQAGGEGSNAGEASGAEGRRPASRTTKPAAVAPARKRAVEAAGRRAAGGTAAGHAAEARGGPARSRAGRPAGRGTVPSPAERRPSMPDRPPPRPPAKAEIFVEGDHVVYPTHGVGKVERIATEEIAGHKLELIHITFEENRMTLRVPVAKARSAGLRKLATRKLFDEALAVLKGRARIKRTMWSRRAQEYEAKINSGDPLAIAEVVRDLHRNAGQPDQSFSERQIYEAAMDRLAAELAALDKTDKLTAATKLTKFLKTV